MLIAKFFLRVLKVMNSETSPGSLATAFALGVFLGLVPFASLQGVVLLCVVLFLRVNLTATLATFLITWLTAPMYVAQLHELGTRLLEDPARADFWRSITNHSVLSFANLGHTVTLGSTVVGLAAFLPVCVLGFFAIRTYRHHLEPRIVQSRWFKALKGLKIVSLYRSVSSPFG